MKTTFRDMCKRTAHIMSFPADMIRPAEIQMAVLLFALQHSLQDEESIDKAIDVGAKRFAEYYNKDPETLVSTLYPRVNQ